MLDLKKLEEKLDRALANETSESLTSWLQEKRLRVFLETLGEGTFSNLNTTSSNSFLKSQNINFDTSFCEVSFSLDYPNAA